MICNELRRLMDWANAAAVYLDKYRDSLVEHGADYDDPTIDAITHLTGAYLTTIRRLFMSRHDSPLPCDAEDSDWISDYDTRHKEEL